MSVSGRALALAYMALLVSPLVPHSSAQAGSPTCSLPTLKTVSVNNVAALRSALKTAQPGHRIQLADGVYAGRFSLLTSGTATQRIQVCGGPRAVLDGGSWSTGYGLTVKASNVDLVGFSVTNSQKGIMLDTASSNLLEGLTVSRIGDEGVHFRTGSSDNVVLKSTIHHTGLRVPEFGEGVYVGSAYKNWCVTGSNCGPDRSDRNDVIGSTFWANGSEAVDIKEGTTGTLVTGNRFDGTGSTALSWVNAKGNDALVTGNTGRVARRDGFLTEVGAAGWGVRNVFALNVADVRGPGYGVNVKAGNPVPCTNVVTNAAKGYSNIACR